MKKWEYLTTAGNLNFTKNKIEYVGLQNVYENAQEMLEELGRDGWDLVSVVPIIIDSKTISERFYFKRKAKNK